ncbi:IS66 family insertion sequence element accessory protein TnpB [Pseudomonas sp. ZS1P83]
MERLQKSDTPNSLHPGQDIAAGADASGPACHDPNRSAAFKRRSRCELAGRECSSVFRFPARPAAMIRIDSIWLATEPMDMRAGTDTALSRVVAVFGAAKPHCAYLFAHRRANRMKVLVHDSVGIWLAARRLQQGRFFWPGVRNGSEVELDAEQLQALVSA